MRKIIILIVLLGLSMKAYALEKPTHEALNEKVAALSGVNDYLRQQVGFPKGLGTSIDNKKVIEWLKRGGKKEDEPMYTRSFNHFHNPLKLWDKAGLKGTSKSAVIWAQDQGSFGSLFGGNYSWEAVREYYYTALTGRDLNQNVVAPTQAEKEKYFGKAFQGIGQLMHLVQDMSVPAHTRDDAHVVGYHYEIAVDKLRLADDQKFLYALDNPLSFAPSILTLTPNPLAPIPIAKIFDTDQYNGSSPNATASSSIGLSEYTNANFVSEGLISANFQDFPYPRIQDTTIIGKSFASPSGTNIRQYYTKDCCGETNSGKGYLLAVVDYLDYWRQKNPLLSAGLPRIPVLDDKVYNDYAALLIPRAVGYSAGLLNYFFRGNIEITLPDSGVYAETDTPATGFTEITLRAKNTSANSEQMTDGTIELVIGYRRAIDDPFLNYPEEYPFQAENEITYIVVPEKNGIRSIPSDGTVELTFDLSKKPVPLRAINVFIRLVYHGRLGNEEGAVVVGFKDISEPTPMDFFNDMDQICLNGTMYPAGSAAAIDQVDTNNNGVPAWDVYPHDLENIYCKVSPFATPQYASAADNNFVIPYLNAGYFVRASYILTDYTFSYNSLQTLLKTSQEDPWYHLSWGTEMYPGVAIKNQVEYEENPEVCAPMSAPCHIWWYPTFLEYRGGDIWWGAGIMFINKTYPEGSACDCYQGVLRNCMSGTQSFKASDSTGKTGIAQHDSADVNATESNAQILPLTHKQRRSLPGN
ncbi:MAG: hypothetical protein AB1552_06815 [Nitrospirota bacterium]